MKVWKNPYKQTSKRFMTSAANTTESGFLAHMIHVVSKEWGEKKVWSLFSVATRRSYKASQSFHITADLPPGDFFFLAPLITDRIHEQESKYLGRSYEGLSVPSGTEKVKGVKQSWTTAYLHCITASGIALSVIDINDLSFPGSPSIRERDPVWTSQMDPSPPPPFFQD